MVIEMIPFVKENIIPIGKYLVKTKTKYGKQFLQARVNMGKKDGKAIMVIDVDNQVVELISKEKLL